ncbi:hypothetical protein EV659_11711 [Rhodothalassium salexigens DSM 2132]|uniref:Mobilization protein MobC n=1 Tax=Rhodothalassium salexigens DSM 2132 TaxID=1188247 RepID=A0A4R2P6W6_RHOSA|nr:hypothetical protein [Rhodothalassium salexigens]MBB4212783.1 hypothetical protein [Rhodothalassium salexigens DSM 2132]TCP29904.1 hypothetical protein EV659_11711 [Rhodothalassium salexigens DSM 2132]
MDRLTPKWGSFGGSGSKSSGSGQNTGAAHKSGKPDKKRPAPFSLRLSFEEKQKLIEDAGRQSISAYIKERLFDPDTPVKQARGLNPVKDQKALAQLLGMLGSSRIAKNLNELADAARVGALPINEDTEKAIKRACDDVRIMRRFLLAALGIRETNKATHVCESCSSAFGRAASDRGESTPDGEPSP